MQHYRVTGLDPSPFRPLFGLPDEDLRRRNAIRYVVDAAPGYPDRIELRDAQPGETVLLVNFEHQSASTPYRASHAIFVREGASKAYEGFDRIPEALRIRLISLRAFDRHGMMVDADVAEGRDLEPLIARFLADPDVAYLQAHHARQGCYAARIDRARNERSITATERDVILQG